MRFSLDFLRDIFPSCVILIKAGRVLSKIGTIGRVPTNMKNPRKVLILHCGGIGDLVLVSDVLASLREAWPEAHISLLCRDVWAGISADRVARGTSHPIEPGDVGENESIATCIAGRL